MYTVSEIFNISFYFYELEKHINSYRLLYKIISDKEFISHCYSINFTFINNWIEHYELLKIKNYIYNYIYFKLNYENNYKKFI